MRAQIEAGNNVKGGMEKGVDKKAKSLFTVSLLVLAVLTNSDLVVGIASAETLPQIYVDPPTISTTVGSEFTININIADVTIENSENGVYGWQLLMSFNSSLIEAVNITEGAWLKSAGGTWWWPAIENDEGTLDAFAVLLPYPSVGATGSGTLANITFRVLAAGVCSLYLSKTSLLTYSGTKILPVSHTKVDGSVTATPGHDVAVVRVTAPPEAASGSSVPINVTVENQGSYNETVTVNVYKGTSLIDTATFDLNAGEDTIRSFSWDTTGVPKGTYTIKGNASITVDNDTTDNLKIKAIRILEHDVAVIQIYAPSTATAGATVPINVEVQNQGSYTPETANVVIKYDSTPIDNKNVILASGTKANASFSWNTSGISTGNYTLNATANISVDDDPTDNSKNKTIKLKLFHDVAVINLASPTDILVGQWLPIDVTVRNEGDFAETANVTIQYDSTYINSESVALAIGETKNVSFQWYPKLMGVGPGLYTLRARATIPVDDDLTDNSRKKTVRISSHDIAVIGIEAPSKAFANFQFYINVTVRNEGAHRENITLILKYDSNLIASQTFDLTVGETREVSFIWLLAGVSLGTYTINATADVLASCWNPLGIDMDPADNFDTTSIPVYQWILGDGDFNGLVEMPDFYIWRKYFGIPPPWPIDLNPDYDPVKSPGYVDMYDFYAWRKHWGQTVDP